MDHDGFMRRALWTSFFFNLGGAVIFGFPGSFLGSLAGLPPDVPALYRATVVWFVVLFGGTYAWLAQQPQIHRPLVAFAAIGKAGFVALTFVLFLFGAATGRGLMTASGDLVFAGIFAWWLAATPSR